ncbi:MAG: beta strand repeat-containing protein, partial [Flavobacteriia bacterium]
MKRLFTRFIAVVSAVVMSTSVSGQCAPDVTPPSVVCGVTGTQNVNAGSSCTYLKTGTDWDAVGSDNCSVASTLYALTGAGSSSPGTNTGTSLDGVQFVLGTTTVTWTVTDGAGLTSTCSYTVIVADVTPPTIVTCPTSTNFFVDATPPGNCVHKITGVDQVYLYPSVTDNCTAGGSLSYELTYFPPSGPSVGPLTNPNLIGTNLQKGGTLFVWRVRDAAGNYSSNCSYTITVVDNTPPVLTCGASGPQNVTANASCKYVVSGTAWNSTATDNCAVSSLTYSLSGVTTGSGTSLNGVQFNLGTTTVTWTATDNAATPNTSTCSYTVVVSDVTPPVLTCNNTINQNLNTDLGECTYTNIGDWEADAIDNCSVTSVLATLTGATTGTALTTLTNQAFNVGTTVVTWTATDGSGNTTTCSFNVTVTDVELPQAICQNITVQLDATGVATITPADIDNGSNDACGIQPLVLDITSFDCTNVGANTVELTVTDNNNNVSTCTATVTVEDNVDPIAICQNITVQLDASGAATITPAVIDNGSNDACGILNLALDITSFDCTNVGANTVELTVTDNNGNTSTCTSTVTVEDNVDPIAICQNITVQLDATGAATITPADVDNGSNDACGILNLALDITSFDCTNIGGNTVQLTVTDNNNNISTCTATITVEDNVAPQAICQNITVQLDATGVATIAPSDIDNGSNDACGIQPLVLDITSFDCTNVGANTVELTVTDNNNNVSTCTATVTVEDNVDPIAICQNITVQLDASGVASITPAEIDNGSNDACGILNLALDITSFDCTNVGTNTVELTVTDNNGNTTTCTSTVTVEDNVDPIAICQNITVQLDATGAATITPADVDNGSNDACGIQPLVLDITNFDCTNVGPNTVQLTVTDNNGNLSTCSATVTVVDNLAPVINCTQSDTLLISADAGVCTYLHSGFAWDVTSASDNCDPSPVITFELTDIIGNPIGSGITLDNVVFSGLTNVIWTATDIYGNAGTCSFVVVIQDSVAPIIDLCTTNQSVLSDPSYCTYTVPNDTWDINGTDNCGSVSYVYELSGATIDTVNNTLFNVAFNLGTTNVTAILLDGAGNSDTCSFNVIVEDTELPIITTCGAIIDTTVVADAGVCTYTNVGFGWDALATDNCSIDSISYTLTGATTANGLTTLDGLVFGLDTTLVTWMVTDGSGNTTTCSFNVIVEDTELPIITTCGAIIDTTVVADAGVCTYTNNGFGLDALATDNCSIDSISYTLTGATLLNGLTTLDGITFEADTTLVTWTATDGSGNTTTCSFNVIVEDTELPVITTCGAIIDTTVVADAGVCTYTNNGLGWDALATDNCSLDSISYTLTGATVASGLTTLDGFEFDLDTTLVTWTATDGSGNTTTCSFNVIVQDNELPLITCAADQTVIADAGVCTYANIGTGWDALVTDNCSIDSISYTLTGATVASGLTTLDGFVFELDTTLVTWTATDGAGNTTSCSFNVIVEDTELPIITCIADSTVST